MTPNNSQPTFTGTETGYVDELGRLVLPQKWREALADCEIGNLLLSNGEDDLRLVVYPNPGGRPGSCYPSPTPAWGNLSTRGEFQHRADCKGRINTPYQFRERFSGKNVMLDGCQTHIVVRTTGLTI